MQYFGRHTVPNLTYNVYLVKLPVLSSVNNFENNFPWAQKKYLIIELYQVYKKNLINFFIHLRNFKSSTVLWH